MKAMVHTLITTPTKIRQKVSRPFQEIVLDKIGKYIHRDIEAVDRLGLKAFIMARQGLIYVVVLENLPHSTRGTLQKYK